MNAPLQFEAGEIRTVEVLCEDPARALCRGRQVDPSGGLTSVLIVSPVAEQPPPAFLERLVHEYELRDLLDAAWCAKPIEIRRESGRTLLLLEDAGGEPLERLLGAPIETDRFLRLAISIVAALDKVHQRGLIHKDVKPTNILVHCFDGGTRFTGFDIASRLPRERQAAEPPEVISGTPAYIAPEQTGRMNRSIDSRSDLYALGVTFYRMLTGVLPFAATDSVEWIHSHIAKRPTPPAERSSAIAAQLSDIVMKLLAKMAEERYQTAAGLEHDLRRCLVEWERNGSIERFRLGERDAPDRLLICERLYGREQDVEALLAAFGRVVAGGQPELVLVSGQSGIGKSSVVNELRKALVPTRGLFASGKFDQLKREVPYATLAQAFQSLVRSLLGQSDAELARWRAELLEALTSNGRLVVDLAPQLDHVIGEQQPVPELEPQQAKRRFQATVRRFVSVFARPEHPLVIFLDDLQWLDEASLDLLQDILTRSDLGQLMLIGAYRDNEVNDDHLLARKLSTIRNSGARVSEIRLGPLNVKQIGQLIGDALRCAPHETAPLDALVEARTAGNPFFVNQYLHTLADEGLLAFDRQARRWAWNIGRINAERYADNVVDLIAEKLSRLPDRAQKAVRDLACLGGAATVSTLVVAFDAFEDEVHAALWDATRVELIERLPGAYRFIHDRVQEAAYSTMSEEQRAAAHLRIGRLLAANTPADSRDEAIFDIVNQLSRGSALIVAPHEREQLAELNLVAGKRAKASSAYGSALTYFAGGAALLAENAWRRRRKLAFELELNRAECEFLCGEYAEAERRLAALAAMAVDPVEQAAVACLRIDLYTTLGQASRAVATGLDCLREFGIDWSEHPTKEAVRSEYERVWSTLGDNKIEELVGLRVMSDPASLATLSVLTKIGTPAFLLDANLCAMTICRAIYLSLEYGNCDGSCMPYIGLGMIAGPFFGDYDAGFRFAQVGYELVDRRGFRRFEAATYENYADLILPWTTPVLASRDLRRRAFEAANRDGDLTYAAYYWPHAVTNMLAAGDPLAEVQREAEKGVAFAQAARFGIVIDLLHAQLALVRTLRGITPTFGCLDDDPLSEVQFERHLTSDPSLASAEAWHWIRKLQARYLAHDYVAAADASSQAQRLSRISDSHLEAVELCFYGALTHAARCPSTDSGERRRHLDALAAQSKQLEDWAKRCPENFEDRAALVCAEIARIEGRELDAMSLYELAIRSARANGFVHNEALANELAAGFYAATGFERIARAYLQDARLNYQRWGADGKVRQLEQLHPHLRTEFPSLDPTNTISTPVEQLDLATVIRVSQAISGEIVVEKLIDTLMRTAIEQAGAERGLLIVLVGAEPRIEAEATMDGDLMIVHRHLQPIAADVLPDSVLRYVLRTRDGVISGDAVAEPPFSEDSYVRQRQSLSLLCLPLVNRGKLIGALYLENSLARNVFAPARVSVLKLLSSQAAVSLENTYLYRDLAEREAKIRRLFDANIVGIFIWDLEGRVVESNDAFLDMLGFSREDVVSGRLSWIELTPPDWFDRDERFWIPAYRTTGALRPFEKEFFRKDGSRVPVLIGLAGLEDDAERGVAFVLDLTERKRAEAEVRESEARHQETQMQLAHANRVARTGQFAASIAHEVSQPIAAILTNAQAGLRWLQAEPPEPVEVRQTFERVVRDASRAAAVVQGIRNLVKKAPHHKDRLEINAPVREVVEFSLSEAKKHRVSVRTDFAEGSLSVLGDRVQLQQVVLNLITNAIEAMSGNEELRQLHVTTGRNESGEVLVAVRDTGPGLAPAIKQDLFKAFQTTKPSGLGLGLSICHSIVESHGGRLWASDNSPRGTVFQFALPSDLDEPTHG